ncbi:MAG: isopenicillin N synthase family oxygenase, partial [Armatimonadetes bacterium]|nr:isopenicillin N synthase family oxygenase [Armatimonadota bacterium]
MSTTTLPVLDLQQFHSGDREAFSQALGEALGEIGFFALENHGIPQELIQRAYRVTEAFFLQPEAVKRRSEDLNLQGQRGFTRFGREHARDNPAPDLKEFWHVGRTLPDTDPLAVVYPPNLWPAGIPEFQATLEELYARLDECALTLLEAAALALGEPQPRFREMAERGNSILRLIHYPPLGGAAPPGSVRAAAHEDINLITLLCEATDAGLELLQRDGAWISIRTPPGQIVVDSGDMLQNVTNGVLRSTTHRVVNP